MTPAGCAGGRLATRTGGLKPGTGASDNPAVEGSRGDRGDIVLGWLTKLTVVLAAVGLLGFDAVALGLGRLQAEDAAQEAARAAVSSWRDTSDVQKSYDAAVATLDADPASSIDPQSFHVAPDGAVTLTVTHHAATLLLEKVQPLRKHATSTATVTGRPAT